MSRPRPKANDHRRGRPASPPTYAERHALEISPFTHLYHILWKRRTQWWLEGEGVLGDRKRKGMQFRMPDTVVWENNIPKAWYHWDSKEGIVRKKVDSAGIVRQFTKQMTDRDHDIVACLYTKQTPAGDDGQDEFAVEYLNTHMLNDFLFVKRLGKGCCVLQEFCMVEEGHNDVIQAIWSPCVCFVNRRQNIHALKDTKVALFDKAATFEGPPHLSKALTCTPKLCRLVRACCAEVAAHFHGIDTRSVLSRMVLHLKVDCKSRVWLLNCASSKVTPTGTRHTVASKENALDLNFPLVPARGEQSQGAIVDGVVEKQSELLNNLLVIPYGMIQSETGDTTLLTEASPPGSPTKHSDALMADIGHVATQRDLLKTKRRGEGGNDPKRSSKVQLQGAPTTVTSGGPNVSLVDQQPPESDAGGTLQWLGQVASSPTLDDHTKLQLLLKVVRAQPTERSPPAAAAIRREAPLASPWPMDLFMEISQLLDWLDDLRYQFYCHETLDMQKRGASAGGHAQAKDKAAVTDVGGQVGRLRSRFKSTTAWPISNISFLTVTTLAEHPPTPSTPALEGSFALRAQEAPSPVLHTDEVAKELDRAGLPAGTLARPFHFDFPDDVPADVRDMVVSALQAVPQTAAGSYVAVDHIPLPMLTNRFDAIRQVVLTNRKPPPQTLVAPRDGPCGERAMAAAAEGPAPEEPADFTLDEPASHIESNEAAGGGSSPKSEAPSAHGSGHGSDNPSLGEDASPE